jgi:gamma-glutamyltranspeptidase/glutathione hydrolase
VTALHDLLLGDGPPGARRAAWLAAPAGAGAVTAMLATARDAAAPIHATGAGRLGAVATGSPHATRIGMATMRAGGTAADAAAAAALAMMVADPPNASPAGRAHILWDAPGKPAQAIDGATSAPAALPQGVAALPLPGAVRAILHLHASAGRLPLAAIAGPARDLARDGFALPCELARIWAWRAPELQDGDARRVYLRGGAAPAQGEVFRQPGLATYFDRLIATGADPFADPAFAGPFCDRLAAKGAAWTVDDLAAANPRAGEVIAHDGAGWRLVSIGRQGWGNTLLEIVTQGPVASDTDPLDRELAHLAAILGAFADRAAGGPAPDRPASPDRTTALARALARLPATARGADRDTTHLSVVDRAGMRVALTQSIGPHFGARVADPETGILIAHSYRMAAAPEPRARDVTEQCPCLFDIAGTRLALGAAGSERIPGAIAAVIGGLIAGQPLDRAIAAPRANWLGDHVRAHLDAPAGLEAALDAAGARLTFTGRGPVDHLGIVQAAAIHADGTVAAAADPAYAGAAAAV